VFRTVRFTRSTSLGRRTLFAALFVWGLHRISVSPSLWPLSRRLTTIYARSEMRIDPKGTIAGYPSLQVRRALKRLHFDLRWDTARLEVAAALPPGDGQAFAKALVAAGLAEAVGKGVWTITQAGQSLSSATAARRVTRATAEKALAEFLGRVDHVNRSGGFLGKVVTVVLFGSMLQPEVDRPSDVDLAVDIAPKEADAEKARAKNEGHVRMLESLGHRFRGFLERQCFWHYEAFHYLKGRSRVISLADLKAEGEFVLAAPHRILYADGAWKPDAPPRAKVIRRREKPSAESPFF
jgi:predicted nucleotidyltransferase